MISREIIVTWRIVKSSLYCSNNIILSKEILRKAVIKLSQPNENGNVQYMVPLYQINEYSYVSKLAISKL